MALTVKIFFKTETITCGKDEEKQKFEISQLMPAGASLAALEGDSETSSKTSSDQKGDIELVQGSFVEFSADKRALLATQPGYPRLTKKKEGSGERIVIDLEPLLSISDDSWSVKMTLYPSLEETELPDSGEILALLKKADVRWGVREKNIEACIKTVENEKKPLKNHVVARGRLPVNGKNARLRIDIESGAQPGKKLEDGRMDYRERQVFIGVDKGQLLATKIHATTGLPGLNIYGHEVPQVPGKDIVVKSAADVVFNEKTGEIRAAIDGVLSVVNDTGVKVNSKHVISGDIDYETGNIDSRDAVDISGSVKPGFKVATGGDVVIGGNLESAQVVSRANILIRGGMTGKGSTLQAEGDVDIPFIEGGSIACKGSVKITHEAYYADIRCLQNISFEGEAKVVGSKLFAGGSIAVIQADTNTSPNSFLAAATDHERYSHYQKLLENVHQAQAAVESWRRRFGPDVTSDDLRKLEGKLMAALSAMTSFNFVPASDSDDKAGGLRYACIQKISIADTILTGAVIRIGNTETTLKKNYKDGHFSLNSETEKIEFHANGKHPGIATQPV